MWKPVVALLGLALLGAMAGQLVAPLRARACDCTTPSWRLELAQVTSSDANVDHTEYWPASATLSAYDGYAGIDSNGPYEPGSVSYAQAQEF
jgi:hypothetical protein